MKKQFIYLLLTMLVFSYCSKKSDPAPTPATPTVKDKKPKNIPDTTTLGSRSQPSSGGNVSYGSNSSSVGLAGSTSLNTGGQNRFDAMTGSNTGLRVSGTKSDYIGWFIDEIYVYDGVEDEWIDLTAALEDDLDFVTLYFQDGSYLWYDFSDEDWDWGWFYIDNGFNYLAYDLGEVDEEVWAVDDAGFIGPGQSLQIWMYTYFDDGSTSFEIYVVYGAYYLSD